MHLVVLVLHVLGAAVLSAVVISGIFLAFSGPVSTEKLAIFKPLRIMGPISAGWTLLTGLYLYFSEADKFHNNKLFWAKIGLFVFDGIIAIFFVDRKIALSETTKDPKIIAKHKVGTWVIANLLILTSIITIGVILANAD